MPLASTIMGGSRACLNDIGAQLYTNDALLPYLKLAWGILQGRMRSAGIAVVHDSGAVLTVPAGTTVLSSSSTPTLPTDIIQITTLHEKGESEGDEFYTLMDDVTYLPDVPQSNHLNFYAWVEGRLEFVGATETRVVRIRYVRTLAPITSADTEITTLGVESYLEFKTAALAAVLVGQNPARGSYLEGEAAGALANYLNTEVKGLQGDPIMRKPYGFSRRKKKWHTR